MKAASHIMGMAGLSRVAVDEGWSGDCQAEREKQHHGNHGRVSLVVFRREYSQSS